MKQLVAMAFLFHFSLVSQAQLDTNKFIPSKWPYFGQNIPAYIGVIIGYEGFKSSYFETGINYNLAPLTVYPSSGAFAGIQFLYRKNFIHNIQAFEIDIGIYSPVSLGVNFNYNFDGTNTTRGFKPFIGTSIYRLQIIYGYNIFSDKRNKIVPLNHSTLTVRYEIPVIRLNYFKKKPSI